MSLHFARNCPAGHPGIAVVVMSAVNTSALDVRDFLFQAAVPKVTRSLLSVVFLNRGFRCVRMAFGIREHLKYLQDIAV